MKVQDRKPYKITEDQEEAKAVGNSSKTCETRWREKS